jgi:archaellum component FlaF (FlaF/FlaG flagellin family)
MYRVTTPTHTFNLPFETSLIDKLILTYKQNGKTIIEKTEADVEMDGTKVSVTFTQQETALFKADIAKVQMRVKSGEKVMASNILTVNVNEVLNKEVL